MAAVEGVRGGGVEVVAVGDERVVAPVGPQLALGACEAAAAYDQAQLLAGLASGPRSASPRRPGSMVVSATWARPPRVYAIACQASSSMAATAALTLAFCGIVIE